MFLPNQFCFQSPPFDVNAAAPSDVYVALNIPFPRCILRNPTIVNAGSSDIHLATIGLYSQAAGAGLELVAPTALNLITGLFQGQDLPLNAQTVLYPINGDHVYVRLTVAAGVAGTAQLFCEFFPRF